MTPRVHGVGVLSFHCKNHGGMATFVCALMWETTWELKKAPLGRRSIYRTGRSSFLNVEWLDSMFHPVHCLIPYQRHPCYDEVTTPSELTRRLSQRQLQHRRIANLFIHTTLRRLLRLKKYQATPPCSKTTCNGILMARRRAHCVTEICIENRAGRWYVK